MSTDRQARLDAARLAVVAAAKHLRVVWRSNYKHPETKAAAVDSVCSVVADLERIEQGNKEEK